MFVKIFLRNMNISINTAHNVDINYTPAGVFDRILATIIDYALLLGLYILGNFAMTPIYETSGFSYWPMVILFIVLSFYHLVCEYAFNGRSLGKMTMKIQVVKLNGKKLTFWDCLLRWVFRLVDITATSGSVAVVSIIATKHMQRLGDMAAGTTVVRFEKKITLQQMSRFDAPEEYKVIFQQAALLSDKDIKIIKEVLQEVHKNKNYNLLAPLYTKIKEITGIETNMVPLEFIETIVKDYTYMANH